MRRARYAALREWFFWFLLIYSIVVHDYTGSSVSVVMGLVIFSCSRNCNWKSEHSNRQLSCTQHRAHKCNAQRDAIEWDCDFCTWTITRILNTEESVGCNTIHSQCLFIRFFFLFSHVKHNDRLCFRCFIATADVNSTHLKCATRIVRFISRYWVKWKQNPITCCSVESIKWDDRLAQIWVDKKHDTRNANG